MIKGVNHVGIIVRSIDETLECLSGAFGAVELNRRSFPELGQTSCIVQLGNSQLELMEPCGERGVVPKFLAEHGPGLHHVSLLSDDLDGDYRHCVQRGLKMLGEPGGELRVVFTHPKSTGGVIYELTDLPFQPGQ